MRRLYLHEPRYQAGNQRHLTGIVIASADGKHRRRINTWAYDTAGRAILAIQAPPSSSTGKVSNDNRQQPGQGRYGLLFLTDTHGHTSLYDTAQQGRRYNHLVNGASASRELYNPRPTTP